MSEGGLEPPCPNRALAPQASASAYSATRTHLDGQRTQSSRITIANLVTARRGHDPTVCRPRWHYGRMTTITAQQEVAGLASDLIRIDTTNMGDDSGPGERRAAEHVAGLLAEVGLEPTLLESRKNRASVVTRFEGADPSRPALLIHGHLDVVPADAADWRVHPLSGEVARWLRLGPRRGRHEGHGRDDARGRAPAAARRPQATARHRARVPRRRGGGRQPRRRLARRQPPGLFEGVTEAIGEVGGFSAVIGGQRLYLLQTAEKGMAWLRLLARGTAGHGSMLNADNAVTEVAEAVAQDRAARMAGTPDSRRSRPSWRLPAEALGVSFSHNEPAAVLDKIGPIARMIGATLTNTANPTMLNAGYKVNVVPAGCLGADRRPLPAGPRGGVLRGNRRAARTERAARVRQQLDRHGDHVRRRALRGHDDGPARGRSRRARSCRTACQAARTGSLSAGWGSAASGSRRSGCRPDLDFSGLFHGVDERVPVDALEFGTRVLDRFIDLC